MNCKSKINSEPEHPDFLHTLKLTSVTLAGGILCHVCNKTYQNKKDYDIHYKQHDSNNIVYTCIVCRKQINSYPSFRGHCYTNHVIKNRYECKHCYKKVSTKFALQEHIKAMHSFTCTIKGCKLRFPTQNELTIHKIIHKNEENKPPYQCQTCDKQITTIDETERHVDMHCTFTYTCPICNKEFQKNESVEHLKKHFEESVTENNDSIENNVETLENEVSELSSIDIVGGILCCHCRHTFNNRELFDNHFSLKHANMKLVYSCILCEKQFEKYALFGGHCYDHVAKTKFECEECNKSFSRLCHLVMHTDMYHTRGVGPHSDGAPLQCAHCPSTFFGDRRYRNHLQTKHNTETIDCPEPGCTSKFHTKKELFLHAKLHKSLNNWCRQCGLQLLTLSSCEKHLDVHRKKLYPCPICNRSYRDKHRLSTHLMQHFETTLHVCKTCGKVYNAKRRLVEHVKIHSSVKSYKCQHCSKSFAKTNHLKQHLATHTGIKPYKCTVCSKTFATYPNWHKHLKKMHNLDKHSIKNISTNNNSDAKKTHKPEPEIVINVPKNRDVLEFESDDSTMDSDTVATVNNVVSAVIKEESMIFKTAMDIGTANEINIESNILPDDIADFATEGSEGATLLPAPAATRVPREYGPDFGDAAYGVPGKFIDLDDHLLHIDPRLTTVVSHDVTSDDDVTAYICSNEPLQCDYDTMAAMEQTWNPPVIAKVYSNFFNEINDKGANLLSVMKSDVF